MALESVIEWQRAAETIRKYVEQHPGCRMQEVVAGTKYTYEEIAGVVEGMVDGCRLERWESYGFSHFYIQGTHTPMPTTNAPKGHDRYIEVYLDAFDEFCDMMRERYGAEVIENLSTEAMISLYRGFLTALPDMEKAGGKK